jgi:hypothetical protein
VACCGCCSKLVPVRAPRTPEVWRGLQAAAAGEDHGIDHHKNWLRFPYVFIFSRSHDLHPHPYVAFFGGAMIAGTLCARADIERSWAPLRSQETRRCIARHSGGEQMPQRSFSPPRRRRRPTISLWPPTAPGSARCIWRAQGLPHPTWLPQVSQNGWSWSRCGRNLAARASGFDTHRHSITGRFDCRRCRGG